MWAPRIASFGFALAGILAGIVYNSQYGHVWLRTGNLSGLEFFLRVTAVITIFVMIVSGIGGVIASYGIELDGIGRMVAKKNFIGRNFVRLYAADNFCRVARATGWRTLFVLSLGALCAAAVITLLLTHPPNTLTLSHTAPLSC
jgi:hypothetical protein